MWLTKHDKKSLRYYYFHIDYDGDSDDEKLEHWEVKQYSINPIPRLSLCSSYINLIRHLVLNNDTVYVYIVYIVDYTKEIWNNDDMCGLVVMMV